MASVSYSTFPSILDSLLVGRIYTLIMEKVWRQRTGRDLGSRSTLISRIREAVSNIDPIFSLVLVSYVVCGLLLIPEYLYRLNPDGVSYIAVAQKYLAGDFSSAVNGYWAPLFSWLMTPFLALTSFAPLAEKQLALTIGFFTLLSIRTLSLTLGLSRTSALVAVTAIVPFVLFMALCMITPDLLMVGVLATYLSAVFKPAYTSNKSRGAVCGALGAVAYFAKSYCFPFFLVHFLFFNSIHYFRSNTNAERRVVLHNLVVGFIVFLTISGAWVLSISNKYEHLTISTAASYNLKLTYSNEDHLPMLSRSLFQPGDMADTSVWIDPTHDLKQSWNPFATNVSFKQLARQIIKNIKRIVDIFTWASLLVIPILLTGVIYLIPYSRKLFSNPVFYILATVFVYCGGYALIFVLPRYIMVTVVLAMIAGCYFIDLLSAKAFFSRSHRIVALLFLTLTFWISPVNYIAGHRNIGKIVYELSEDIKHEYQITGNIASDTNWNKMAYLAFYNDYAYFGKTGDKLSDAELKKTLEENSIDYYFVWGKPSHNINFLRQHEEISNGKFPGMGIYRLKSRE